MSSSSIYVKTRFYVVFRTPVLKDIRQAAAFIHESLKYLFHVIIFRNFFLKIFSTITNYNFYLSLSSMFVDESWQIFYLLAIVY